MRMELEEIRGVARTVLEQEKTPRTVEQYQRRLQRLAGQHWRDYVAGRDLAQRTINHYKAAYQFGVAQEIQRLLAIHDEAWKDGDPGRAGTARDQAEAWARTIQTEMDYEKQNFRLERAAACRGRRPSQSKRQTLKNLPGDWANRLLDSVRKEDRFPLLAMLVGGLRPVELEKGVRIRVVDHQAVRIEVTGAKTQQGYGQRWRAFTVSGDLAGQLAEMLQQWDWWELETALPQRGKDPVANFRRRISRVAKRAGLRDVSSYTLRHRFAAEVKALGVSRQTLGGALGHCVDRTSKVYGHARQGGGSIGLEDVQTATPVKATKGLGLEPDQEEEPSPR